jgi:hypothetical protein
MENPGRDMDPVKRKKKEITRSSKNRKRLTIMIFKKVGKARTFEISSRLLLWVSLFFLFYIVVTVFLTNEYFNIYRKNKIQTDIIAELSGDLINTTKDLEQSKRDIAFLNDYIKEQEGQSPEPMSTVSVTEASSPKIVDIEEISVNRDRSKINVNFRIVNKQLNEEPIGGYIFVLASIKDSGQSDIWVYPSSPLKDGLPVDYRSGQRFLIQRFRTISSKYSISKSTNKPLILEIMVYDRNGKLILKKVVEA